jgi:cytochrome c5
MNKVLITIVAATLVIAGCSDKQDAASGQAETSVVEKTMDSAKGTMSEMSEAAGDAVDSTAEMASDAGKTASEISDGGATGQKIYKQSCQACHANGVANAPKPGDKAAWAPRIATGMDAMLATAKKGKGAMPPKGTCMGCSDADLKAAIEYMVSQSK